MTFGEKPELREIIVNHNKLQTIDIRKAPKLQGLSIDFNQIKSLDLGQNGSLEQLYCKKNPLATIPMQQLPKLTTLSCEAIGISELDLSHNPLIKKIYCGDNKIKKLDLSRATKLEELNCKFNALTELDLSTCTELTELYCFENELTTLSLANNKKLTILSAGVNGLTKLDLSGLTKLQEVSLSFNQLTQLKLANCPSIGALALDHNALTELDLSGATHLQGLYLSNNKIAGEAALRLVRTLPDRSGDERGILMCYNKAEFPDDTEGNNFPEEALKLAKDRNWIASDGETPLPLGNPAITGEETSTHDLTIDASGCVALSDYYAAQLYSADGMLLSSYAHGAPISLNQMPHGLYLLRVTKPNGVVYTARLLWHVR